MVVSRTTNLLVISQASLHIFRSKKNSSYEATYLTRVLGITRRATARHEKVMGSMLGQNCVIAKYVKSCNFCCYGICATLIVRVGGNVFAPNRRNSLPCTVRTSRQWSCNQKVGCLLWDVFVDLKAMYVYHKQRICIRSQLDLKEISCNTICAVSLHLSMFVCSVFFMLMYIIQSLFIYVYISYH